MATEIFKLVGRVTYEGQQAVEKGLANLNKKVGKAEQSMKKFGDKTKEIGDKMNDVGKNLTAKVTAPLMGLGALAGMTFANFDDSMRAVNATLGDKLGKSTEEAEKNMQALRDKAQELGASTAFSASQAADGMNKLALAGWDTNQILAATGPMLDLASASQMDLAQAADIVTDQMTAFGLGADKATMATDVFAKVQSSANTDVAGLGEALKMTGSNSAAAGMDLQQTSAILGSLANASIKGSSAGTSLNAMLRDLKKGAEDGVVSFGEFDVQLYNSDGTMRDLTSVLADVEKGTAKMTQEQKDAALGSIFMEESQRGVNAILGQGTDAVKALEDQLYNSEGAAAGMKEEMEGGLGGAMRGMKSAIEGVAISFGETLAPYIQQAAGWVTDIAQKFGSLDEKTRLIIITIAGLAAAIGPLLMVFGLIAQSIGTIISLIGTIGIATSGWILLIAAVVAALIYAYTQFEWFRDMVHAVFQYIRDLVEPIIMDFVEFFKQKIAEIKAWWDEYGGMIQEAFQNVFGFIGAVIKKLVDFAWPMVEMFIAGIKDIIDGGLKFIMGLVEFFAALFTGNWSAMWDAVKKMLSGAIQAIWGFFQTGFIGKIFKVVTAFGGKVVSFIVNWNKNLLNLITGMINRVKGFFTNMGSSIRTTTSNAFNKVKDLMMKPIEKARSFIKSQLDKIKGFFDKLKLKFPKLKLPHFSIKGEFSLMPPKVPKLNIDWYKKGGVFGGPSIIGVGEEPGVSEAVVPLKKSVLAQIGEGIAAAGGTGRRAPAAKTHETINNDNRNVNITIDAGNIEELLRVIEMFTGLKQTVRRG